MVTGEVHHDWVSPWGDVYKWRRIEQDDGSVMYRYVRTSTQRKPQIRVAGSKTLDMFGMNGDKGDDNGRWVEWKGSLKRSLAHDRRMRKASLGLSNRR